MIDKVKDSTPFEDAMERRFESVMEQLLKDGGIDPPDSFKDLMYNVFMDGALCAKNHILEILTFTLSRELLGPDISSFVEDGTLSPGAKYMLKDMLKDMLK